MVLASRVLINDQPTRLEFLVKGALLLLGGAWKLGPPTLLGIFLVALLLFLARLGGVITGWMLAFGLSAAGISLALRAARWRRARQLLGAGITFGAPIPLVLGVYWRTATPATLDWVLALLGSFATAIIPILVIFLPDAVTWIERRLLDGTPVLWPAPAAGAPATAPGPGEGGDAGDPADEVRLPARVLFGWVGAAVGPLVVAWALVTTIHFSGRSSPRRGPSPSPSSPCRSTAGAMSMAASWRISA